MFICRVNSCKQWLCNNIYFASSPWWAIYYKHDFKYFTILQFLQILQASKEESITIRISTTGGTGCVIAIGRAAICIHYPQCGLYPAPLCSVWNVQSTLRVLPRPRIRRLYPQWVLIAPTTTTTIPHCGGNCSGGKAKHLLSCLINTIQHKEDMVITTWLTKSQWYICAHKFCCFWGVTFYFWYFLFVTFDMPSFAIVTFDMPPFYICDIWDATFYICDIRIRGIATFAFVTLPYV